MEVHTLAVEVHTLAMEVHTLAMEVHTLVMEVHTLVMEVHTLAMEVHTLVMEVHTLAVTHRTPLTLPLYFLHGFVLLDLRAVGAPFVVASHSLYGGGRSALQTLHLWPFSCKSLGEGRVQCWQPRGEVAFNY